MFINQLSHWFQLRKFWCCCKDDVFEYFSSTNRYLSFWHWVDKIFYFKNLLLLDFNLEVFYVKCRYVAHEASSYIKLNIFILRWVLRMSRLSLIAGNCGGANGGGDWIWGQNLILASTFSSHFRRTSFRRLNGHWSNGLEGSRVGRGDRFPVLQRVRRGRSIITQLTRWYEYKYLQWTLDLPILLQASRGETETCDSSIWEAFGWYGEEDYWSEPVLNPKLRLWRLFLYFRFRSINLVQVRQMADDAGLDFSDQTGALEIKYQQVYFISISMDVITEFCFYTCCCWSCCSHSLDW